LRALRLRVRDRRLLLPEVRHAHGWSRGLSLGLPCQPTTISAAAAASSPRWSTRCSTTGPPRVSGGGTCDACSTRPGSSSRRRLPDRFHRRRRAALAARAAAAPVDPRGERPCRHQGDHTGEASAATSSGDGAGKSRAGRLGGLGRAAAAAAARWLIGSRISVAMRRTHWWPRQPHAPRHPRRHRWRACHRTALPRAVPGRRSGVGPSRDRRPAGRLSMGGQRLVVGSRCRRSARGRRDARGAHERLADSEADGWVGSGAAQRLALARAAARVERLLLETSALARAPASPRRSARAWGCESSALGGLCQPASSGGGSVRSVTGCASSTAPGAGRRPGRGRLGQWLAALAAPGVVVPAVGAGVPRQSMQKLNEEWKASSCFEASTSACERIASLTESSEPLR
jgi:hypothetical protein